VSLGNTTTDGDIDALLDALPGVIRSARKAGFSERDVAAR
jgi:hypothetical protein